MKKSSKSETVKVSFCTKNRLFLPFCTCFLFGKKDSELKIYVLFGWKQVEMEQEKPLSTEVLVHFVSF